MERTTVGMLTAVPGQYELVKPEPRVPTPGYQGGEWLFRSKGRKRIGVSIQFRYLYN